MHVCRFVDRYVEPATPTCSFGGVNQAGTGIYPAAPSCQTKEGYCAPGSPLNSVSPCEGGTIGSTCPSLVCANGYVAAASVCTANTAASGLWSPALSCAPRTKYCLQKPAGSTTFAISECSSATMGQVCSDLVCQFGLQPDLPDLHGRWQRRRRRCLDTPRLALPSPPSATPSPPRLLVSHRVQPPARVKFAAASAAKLATSEVRASTLPAQTPDRPTTTLAAESGASSRPAPPSPDTAPRPMTCPRPTWRPVGHCAAMHGHRPELLADVCRGL